MTAKENKKVEPSVREETAEKTDEEIQQEGEKDMAAALEEAMNKLKRTRPSMIASQQ